MLSNVPLPAIAQIAVSSGQFHYVVLYGHHVEGHVEALDGTTGRQLRLPNEQLAKHWTGYVLIPSQPTIAMQILARTFAAFLVVGVVGAYLSALSWL